MKCSYCGQDGSFAIKQFKNLQGESYKGKPANSTGSKKRQFNDMNAAEAEEFKQFEAWRELQGKDDYNTPWDKKLKNVELGF